METFIINKQSGILLKTFREENKVTASSIAKSLNKTSAYISKLENGEFKNIQLEIIQGYLNVISNNSNVKNEIINDIMNSQNDFKPEEKILQITNEFISFKKGYNDLICKLNINENVAISLKNNGKENLRLFKENLLSLIEQIEL